MYFVWVLVWVNSASWRDVYWTGRIHTLVWFEEERRICVVPLYTGALGCNLDVVIVWIKLRRQFSQASVLLKLIVFVFDFEPVAE